MEVPTNIENIATLYDLTSVLSAMTACTATFVAIIGGLIASKAISDRAEKESVDRQLYQLDMEIETLDRNIEYLSNWLNESNAKDFIREHINELLDNKPLSDIYDSSDENEIEYEDMLVYWNDAIAAINLYRANLSSERNNQGIPKTILGKLNSFQKDFCSRYKNSIEDYEVSFYEKCGNLTVSSNEINFYNERMDEWTELINKKGNLVIREQVLFERKEQLCAGHDVKNGVYIFITVSVLNIIIPIFLMLFNPMQSKGCFIAETVFSFITFSLGIIAMIIYICSLFPKKEKDEISESKGVKHENE